MTDKPVIAKRRGLSKSHAVVDYEIWQWKSQIEGSRPNYRLTKAEVQKYALEAYKNAGIENFKASDGWYRRWRARWQKSFVSEEKEKPESTQSAEVLKGTRTNILNTKPKNIKSKQNSEKYTKNKVASSKVQTSSCSPKSLFTSKAVFNSDNSLTNSGISSSVTTKDVQNNQIHSDLITNSPCKSPTIHMSKSKGYENKEICKYINQLTPSEITSHSKDQEMVLKETQIFTTDDALDQTSDSRSTCFDPSNMFEPDNSEKAPGDLSQLHEVQMSHLSDLPSKEVQRIPQTFSCTMLNDDKLEIEDHDSFCHTCEDFHPKHKGSNRRCEQIKDCFLLDCANEKTEPKPTNEQLKNLNQPDVKKTKSSHIEVQMQEPRLRNLYTLPKGKRYVEQFKSEVVQFALEHNLKQAADKYKVNRGTISDWLAERRRLSGNSSEIITQTTTSSDSEFLHWLDESKFNITNELLKQKTNEWLQSAEDSSCLWLKMYALRLNGKEDNLITKRYISYPSEFKRVVVFFAETHSNLTASRVFGVARRRILEWQQFPGGKKQNQQDNYLPCNVSDKVVDKKVFEWYSRQKNPPTSKQVRKKAVQLYREAGNDKIECKAQWYYRWRARHKLPPASKQPTADCETKLISWLLCQLDNNKCVTHATLTAQASAVGYPLVARGWSFRFCRKYEKLLAAMPDPTSPLPSALEEQIVKYKELVTDIVKTHDLTPSHILAIDEIPINFLAKDITKKKVLVRRPGFESCQLSLVISALFDGTLLPTLFICKGTLPDSEINNCVIPCVTENGLINNEIMHLWLNQVLFKHFSNSKSRGLMISDFYEFHTIKSVESALKEHNISQAVIPGGCAFKLLPILNLCHMFKSMVEEMCHLSLASQTDTLRPPTVDQLYLWITQIHTHLAKNQTENIRASFNKIFSLDSTINKIN